MHVLQVSNFRVKVQEIVHNAYNDDANSEGIEEATLRLNVIDGDTRAIANCESSYAACRKVYGELLDLSWKYFGAEDLYNALPHK